MPICTSSRPWLLLCGAEAIHTISRSGGIAKYSTFLEGDCSIRGMICSRKSLYSFGSRSLASIHRRVSHGIHTRTTRPDMTWHGMACQDEGVGGSSLLLFLKSPNFFYLGIIK